MSEYSIFPKALDGYAQLPLAVDKRSPINAESVNRLRSAIVNIEKAIGVGPNASKLHGVFDDISSRLESIESVSKSTIDDLEDLSKKLEFQTNFDALYQDLKNILNDLVKDVDFNETLTSLYLDDPNLNMGESPLFFKKDDIVGSIHVQDAFLIESDSKIQLKPGGNFLSDIEEGAFYKIPNSVDIIGNDLEIFPNIFMTNYLSLDKGFGDSPFSIYKLSAGAGAPGSIEVINFAFGANRAPHNESFPDTFDVSFNMFETHGANARGGTFNFRAGDCSENNKPGDIELYAGDSLTEDGTDTVESGATLRLKGGADGIDLYSGELQDGMYSSHMTFGPQTEDFGSTIYLRSGRSNETAGSIYIEGSDGHNVRGGDCIIRAGNSSLNAGDVSIQAGVLAGGALPGAANGDVRITGRRIELNVNDVVNGHVAINGTLIADNISVGSILESVRFDTTGSPQVLVDDHTIIHDGPGNATLNISQLDAQVGRVLVVKNLCTDPLGVLTVVLLGGQQFIEYPGVSSRAVAHLNTIQIQKVSDTKWLIISEFAA